MQGSINQHPIFWRVLQDNPHFQKCWKEINLMWDLICDRLPNKNHIFQTWEQKQALWSSFRSIYAQVESLFSHKHRSDWTPYFYHLLETAFILLEEWDLENVRVEDIFVALLHDIIEDTYQDFNSLWRTLSIKWKEIAFWVHIISKPHFHTHIEDESERQSFLNCVSEIEEDNIDLSWNIVDESLVKDSIVQEYNALRKKYKPIRNRKHFENYRDFETFKSYAKEEAKELWLSFSDTLLDVICKRSINVKLADRLHNLRTLWHMSKKQIDKKINETEEYLLWIADEINPTLAQKIRDQIEKLKSFVPNIKDEIICTVQDCVHAQVST